jgi:hypothetical protein
MKEVKWKRYLKNSYADSSVVGIKTLPQQGERKILL